MASQRVLDKTYLNGKNTGPQFRIQYRLGIWEIWGRAPATDGARIWLIMEYALSYNLAWVACQNAMSRFQVYGWLEQ